TSRVATRRRSGQRRRSPPIGDTAPTASSPRSTTAATWSRRPCRAVDPNVPFGAVHASRGKVARAEPVAALYEQGKVRHLGAFPILEDQMRSEERRVGKECRYGWATYHSKKKKRETK